jgi:hypothetical protein
MYETKAGEKNACVYLHVGILEKHWQNESE